MLYMICPHGMPVINQLNNAESPGHPLPRLIANLGSLLDAFCKTAMLSARRAIKHPQKAISVHMRSE